MASGLSRRPGTQSAIRARHRRLHSPHPDTRLPYAPHATRLSAAALAARFRQGRRVAPKVASVLGALMRMGFASSSDGGRSYALRRVA